MFEFGKIEPGIWAGAAAGLYASISSVAVLLGVPAPSKRQVMAVFFEIFLSVPLAFIIGMGFCIPLSHALTNIFQTVLNEATVDPIGAGILLGLFSYKGLNVLFDSWIKRAAKVIGGSE